MAVYENARGTQMDGMLAELGSAGGLLLPCQFRDSHRCTEARGEVRLWLAVLDDAVREWWVVADPALPVWRYDGGGRNRATRHDELCIWFFGPDLQPGSFRWLCEAVGLDRAYILRLLGRGKPQPVRICPSDHNVEMVQGADGRWRCPACHREVNRQHMRAKRAAA